MPDYKRIIQIDPTKINDLLSHGGYGILIRPAKNGAPNEYAIETNDMAEKGKVDKLVQLFDIGDNSPERVLGLIDKMKIGELQPATVRVQEEYNKGWITENPELFLKAAARFYLEFGDRSDWEMKVKITDAGRMHFIALHKDEGDRDLILE